MSIVALIPARGGSKAIPRKNVALIAGRPLIAHTIAASQAAMEIARTFVSTDCAEIAECSRQCGAEVPYLRPAELSADETPMIPVLVHFLDTLEKTEGFVPEAIVLLQPTSPLRTSATIDLAIRTFRENQADSVVTVIEVPHAFTPGSLLQRDDEGRVSPAFPELGQSLRRQDKPRYFSRSGPAVVVIRPEVLRSGKLYTERTHSVIISQMESWDIDTPADFEAAEALMLGRPSISHV